MKKDTDDSKKQSRSLWIADDLYESLLTLAAEDNRSFSSYVETLLKQYVKRHKHKLPPTL